MILSIIILLILLELKLFKGIFLALWITDLSLRVIIFIVKLVIKIMED